MICVQTAASPSDKRILIASDFGDSKTATQETSDWLRANGYRPVPNARPLLVYENGVCVRQWMQAEPQTGGGSSAAPDVPPAPRPVFGWLSSLLHSRHPGFVAPADCVTTGQRLPPGGLGRYTLFVTASDLSPAPFLLVVSDDLMLPSRIREAAKPLGYDVQTVSGDAAWEAVRRAPSPQAVLVGLTARRFDPLAFIRALKADTPTQNLFVLAFAGHVETEKHQAARDAGADLVVANSSVALHLPQLLARFTKGGAV